MADYTRVTAARLHGEGLVRVGWTGINPADPLQVLALFSAVTGEFGEIDDQIDRAREQGYEWADIARAVGAASDDEGAREAAKRVANAWRRRNPYGRRMTPKERSVLAPPES